MNAERAALGLLLERAPGPAHTDELDRVLGSVPAHDAIASLIRDGLAHREGSLIFASRAAVRGDELAL
jgi:hypothetical protein